MSIGHLFRERRKARKLTQAELAASAGVRRSAYANYESGAREPSLAVLIRLADFYGITLDELVGHAPCREDAGAEERRFLADYRRLSGAGRLRMQNQVSFELALESGLGGPA